MSETDPHVQEEAFQEEAGLHYTDVLRIFGASLVGSLSGMALIGGGVVAYNAIVNPQPGTEIADEYSKDMRAANEELEPLAEACFEPFNWDVEPLDIGAADCVSYYDSTRIALVNYGLDGGELARVAEGVEQELLDQTNGLVHAEIETIHASEAAKLEYMSAQPPDRACADSANDRIWSSTLAEKLMPQLDSYDAVVGITNLPACNETTLGIASSQASLAEVYFPEGMDEDSFETDVMAVTHETLHLFRVGHEGILESMYDPQLESATRADGSTQSLGALIYNLPAGRPLDVERFIDNGMYHEYHGTSAMGPLQVLSEQSRLNPLQQYLLEWPQRALKQEVSIRPHDLADGAVTFAAGDTNTLALLRLTEYMHPSVVEYDEENLPPLFGLVAFVPRDTGADTPVAVDIYALEELGDSTALLGTVPATGGESRSVELTMGSGQSVHVRIDAERNTISLIPNTAQSWPFVEK